MEDLDQNTIMVNRNIAFSSIRSNCWRTRSTLSTEKTTRMLEVWLTLLTLPLMTSTFGTQAPSIPGPRFLDDRIAIIGAGPAGVHMAFKLMELGFMNVEILERTGRIGGKCLDVPHRGIKHPLGAVLLNPNYQEIYDLVSNFSVGKISTLNYRFQVAGSPDGGFDFLTLLASRLNVRNEAELTSRLRNVVRRYITIHRSLLGDYEGYLFPRPPHEVLYQLRGSFQDFLRRYGLFDLEPVVFTLIVSFGYQQLDELPALYGLLWITPTWLEYLQRTRIESQTLEEGLQSLWETIARRMNMKIRFNADIVRIKRRQQMTDGVQIYYRDTNDPTGTVLRKKYDFLIVTPPVKSLQNVMDLYPEERKLFGRQILDTFYVTTLVDSNYGERSLSPREKFLDSVLNYDYDVDAAVDYYATINNITGIDYKAGTLPGGIEGKFVQTAVYYQVGRENPTIPRIAERINWNLDRHLKGVNRHKYRIIFQFKTEYFVRFSRGDVERGRLWDAFDLQGTRNAWFIGAPLIFEAVAPIVEYNKLILRNYNPPLRFKHGYMRK